jgi:hypothetical protein
MNSKKKSETIHAQKRAMERYGIKLNSKIRIAIIKAIQSGEHISAQKLTNRITEHTLELEDGTKIKVLYDKSRHNIVTFLPIRNEEK